MPDLTSVGLAANEYACNPDAVQCYTCCGCASAGAGGRQHCRSAAVAHGGQLCRGICHACKTRRHLQCHPVCGGVSLASVTPQWHGLYLLLTALLMVQVAGASLEACEVLGRRLLGCLVSRISSGASTHFSVQVRNRTILSPVPLALACLALQCFRMYTTYEADLLAHEQESLCPSLWHYPVSWPS